ncbi:hypothetical protein NQZ68_012121 [Dissostichus eleginoides]|nr:hypothetical protein NQZ68_012121 [Dissostichus eleginoides]
MESAIKAPPQWEADTICHAGGWCWVSEQEEAGYSQLQSEAGESLLKYYASKHKHQPRYTLKTKALSIVSVAVPAHSKASKLPQTDEVEALLASPGEITFPHSGF